MSLATIVANLSSPNVDPKLKEHDSNNVVFYVAQYFFQPLEHLTSKTQQPLSDTPQFSRVLPTFQIYGLTKSMDVT